MNSNNSAQPRLYRLNCGSPDLCSFSVRYQETDLWIAIPAGQDSAALRDFCQQESRRLYRELADYIAKDTRFLHSLTPHVPTPDAPPIAQHMASAAAKGHVGPMAAVAGTVAQFLGENLRAKFPLRTLIIENGGDIYLYTAEQHRRVALFAGSSPLSNRLALEFPPSSASLGICTSSGTVGPSLSFGKADAVTVICADVGQADAYATTFGNMVKTAEQIEGVLQIAATYPDILGIVIILGDKIGFRGQVSLVSCS